MILVRYAVVYFAAVALIGLPLMAAVYALGLQSSGLAGMVVGLMAVVPALLIAYWLVR